MLIDTDRYLGYRAIYGEVLKLTVNCGMQTSSQDEINPLCKNINRLDFVELFKKNSTVLVKFQVFPLETQFVSGCFGLQINILTSFKKSVTVYK